MKNKEILFKLAITAIFTAMCYGLTFVSIPLPTGAKVHLGNFVCVLAGMLCGGLIGGITGSIGMGLNDISSGYEWSTFVRTFIVKFILGFSVGILFRILVKRDKTAKITLYTLASVFTLGFIGTLVLYATGAQAYTKDADGNKIANIGTRTHSVVIGETTKTLSTSVLVPIFMGVIALVLIGVIVFLFITRTKNIKVNKVHTTVATVTTISVIINTILEFFLRWFLKGLLVGSDAALAESITKIPSNLITGVVTIVAVTLVYLPIYYALRNQGFGKYLIQSLDEIEENDQAETSELDDTIVTE